MEDSTEKIYRILEDEILPLYYKTSESGVPQDWVKVMRAAMKSHAARFSTRRMIKNSSVVMERCMFLQHDYGILSDLNGHHHDVRGGYTKTS